MTRTRPSRFRCLLSTFLYLCFSVVGIGLCRDLRFDSNVHINMSAQGRDQVHDNDRIRSGSDWRLALSSDHCSHPSAGGSQAGSPLKLMSDISSSTPSLTPQSTGTQDSSSPRPPSKKSRPQAAVYPNVNATNKEQKPFSRSAAKRGSVMALGSIEHLQHYFTKTGLIAKKEYVRTFFNTFPS